MHSTVFKAHHMNATYEDLEGNNGIGRYIFLPGSDSRAREIAEHFDKVTVKSHPRQHNLYLGTIKAGNKKIEVASISTGMGCPSLEIILHELFNLGAKRFLRIGTSATMQPSLVPVGHLVNAQASVRDDGTSQHYAPLEIPAVAALEYVTSILVAAEHLGIAEKVHTGIVHCKSSLYARELAAGPRADVNQAYLNLLCQMGVLATEMESATLFIQSQLYNYQLMQQGDTPEYRVLAGCLLSTVGTVDHFDPTSPQTKEAINHAVELGIESVRVLASQELAG